MFLGNDENLLPPTGWVCLFKQRLLKGTFRPVMPPFRCHESTIPSGGGHVQTKEGVKRRLPDVFRERRKFIAADGEVCLSKQRLLKGTFRPEMPSFRCHESTIPSGGGHAQTKEGVKRRLTDVFRE